MLSDQTLRYGEEFYAITLGIDRLYRKEIGISVEDLHEGLVVLDLGKKQAKNYAGYEEAREVLADYSRLAFALPEADRRLYYSQACLTLDSFCASRMGLLPSLSAQVGLFLHVDPAPISDAEIDALKRAIRQQLNTMGYSGDLQRQCSDWEQKNIVPADEVQETMTALMIEARERTGGIIELPEGDYYRAVTARGCAFNAASYYEERQVVVNIDPVLTLPGLRHLVCHECYPGHFMQFSLRQRLYERGLAAADGLLSVCNHSSSATFEGIADAGIEFISWIENDDDRLMLLLSELKSALGTAASYRLHERKQTPQTVEAWLREQALVGGEGWVANRMRFISDLSRSALIWSYWRGDQGVFAVWRRIAAEDRAGFFASIYDRLHTVQSMQLMG